MPDDEQDDGADDRADEARALIRPVPADRLPEIGRDEGPDDADDRRHDEAARVVRRGRDGAGDQAGNETDDDDPQNAHGGLREGWPADKRVAGVAVRSSSALSAGVFSRTNRGELR